MSKKVNQKPIEEQSKDPYSENMRDTGKILYSKQLANHLQDKINAICYKLVCYASAEQIPKDEDGEPLIGVTYVLDKLEPIEQMAKDIEQVLSGKKPMYVDEKEVFDYWKEHRLFEELQDK